MCLGFHFPMNYMEGVQVDFEKLTTEWTSSETEEDYKHLIIRCNIGH